MERKLYYAWEINRMEETADIVDTLEIVANRMSEYAILLQDATSVSQVNLTGVFDFCGAIGRRLDKQMRETMRRAEEDGCLSEAVDMVYTMRCNKASPDDVDELDFQPEQILGSALWHMDGLRDMLDSDRSQLQTMLDDTREAALHGDTDAPAISTVARWLRCCNECLDKLYDLYAWFCATVPVISDMSVVLDFSK